VSLVVLVPVREFAGAKSRLSAELGPGERADLARYCLARLLEAAMALGPSRLVVITRSPEVTAFAAGRGAECWEEPAEVSGLAKACQVATETLAGPSDRVLIAMADLPRVTGLSLARLLDAPRAADVVLASSASGEGTNAMVLQPGCRLTMHWGHPRSLAMHLDAALQAGLSAQTVALPELELDLDLPDDLRQWRESLAGTPGPHAAGSRS
jgi:2-phospho-L-lactate guanylyltransferase